MNQEQNGVTYLTESKEEFEKLYVKVRTIENRILDDSQVKSLPYTSPDSKYRNEWKKREFTLHKFSSYLKTKSFNNSLEIGCGNGWFTHQLSQYSKHATGLDVGRLELEQAARCFTSTRVNFVCCNDLTLLPEKEYDLIVFNASLQYFELTPQFWDTLNKKLTDKGEIHILDSPFYDTNQLEEAKRRSDSYFESLDTKKASDFYLHLEWDKLPANCEILYKPNKYLNKINKNRSPFPWIKI